MTEKATAFWTEGKTERETAVIDLKGEINGLADAALNEAIGMYDEETAAVTAVATPA